MLVDLQYKRRNATTILLYHTEGEERFQKQHISTVFIKLSEKNSETCVRHY